MDPRLRRTPYAVLQRLLACERGLAEAYAAALRGERRPPREAELVIRGEACHRVHVKVLTQWLGSVLRGGRIAAEADDLWVRGNPSDPAVLLEGERESHEAWHDARLDLPHPVGRGLIEGLLREHHELLRAWQALLRTRADSMITV